jgi:hypothetical protein
VLLFRYLSEQQASFALQLQICNDIEIEGSEKGRRWRFASWGVIVVVMNGARSIFPQKNANFTSHHSQSLNLLTPTLTPAHKLSYPESRHKDNLLLNYSIQFPEPSTQLLHSTAPGACKVVKAIAVARGEKWN